MDSMRYDDGCGRYTLSAGLDELQERYKLAGTPAGFPAGYDLRPGQVLPVIARAGQGEAPLMQFMKWGLVPSWWKKDAKIAFRTFNARDDAVFVSGMWRSIYKRRVLVPSSGYFEWTRPAAATGLPKQKYFFRPKRTRLFSFAGFYDVWKDADGQEWPSYTIITTGPNKEARAIHERMPVILRPGDEAAWLDPAKATREALEPFLHPLPNGSLEVYEVSNDSKAYAADDATRIMPLNSR